jgi:acetoin utilization deacetylase AcuC-like enzyme
MLSYSTGLVFDQHFLSYDPGARSTVATHQGSFAIEPDPHPSSMQIARRTKQFLDGSGLTSLMRPIAARAATQEELLTYHTPEYLAGVQAHAQGGPAQGSWGEIEEDTPLSVASFEAALYAAGGAMEGVKAVLTGEVENAYALLRPPGHHALSNRAMGFCFINNAAIAAHYARQTYHLERIMIIDWDVHHGNGTQDAFYADPGVLFVSLHQQNWYPRCAGELDQVGTGRGAGYTVNIPLPAGTGDRGYRAAFEQLVLPIGLQYRPQLIIVSSGQDASWLDPMAQMMLTKVGFRTISALTLDLAREICDGRLLMLQEGGYSPTYVPYCVVETIEPLLGVDLGLVDLYADSSELDYCTTVFTSATRQALAEARDWYRHWWKL